MTMEHFDIEWPEGYDPRTEDDDSTLFVNEFPDLDGEDAIRIALDIGNGVLPEHSKVNYGPTELAYRKRVEDEFAAILRDDPQAVLHPGSDLPFLDTISRSESVE